MTTLREELEKLAHDMYPPGHLYIAAARKLALAAANLALEAAARECEALLIHNETGVDYTDGCDDCAAAIRAMRIE